MQHEGENTEYQTLQQQHTQTTPHAPASVSTTDDTDEILERELWASDTTLGRLGAGFWASTCAFNGVGTGCGSSTYPLETAGARDAMGDGGGKPDPPRLDAELKLDARDAVLRTLPVELPEFDPENSNVYNMSKHK
eukprot:m.1650434 g.1650434  ORF g.1650434 m.1650434 type:complete len:136 (+) comp86525_c0_seq1:326-733(+)